VDLARIYKTAYSEYWYLILISLILSVPIFFLCAMIVWICAVATDNIIVGWFSGGITFGIFTSLPIIKINSEIAKDICTFKDWNQTKAFVINQLATIAIYFLFGFGLMVIIIPSM